MLSISTDSSNLVMNIVHDVLNRLGLNGDFAEKNMKIGPELAKWDRLMSCKSGHFWRYECALLNYVKLNHL